MGKFELMALPYAPEALEPVISKETIAFHHGKHLAGYVNNLNALLEGSPLAELPLEEIVLKAEGGMLNNAGQILNHNLYFQQSIEVIHIPSQMLSVMERNRLFTNHRLQSIRCVWQCHQFKLSHKI